MSFFVSSSMFSSMSSINEVLRFFQNKCIYCYFANHLYKKNCQTFNEDLKTKKIYLQNKRIHLNLYNLEVAHVKWHSTKINDNAWKKQKNWHNQIASLSFSRRFISSNLKKTFFSSCSQTKKKKTSCWLIMNRTSVLKSF